MSRRAAAVPVEFTQLATRIPKQLARAMKLHCVERERQIQAFVVETIEERLRSARRRSAAGPVATGA